jgi:hypothetical protein
MVVAITWSLSQGGGALTPPIAHGNLGPNEAGTAVDIYIRHDGTEKIYDCGFYLANHDSAEVLGWGNNGTNEHGFQIDMNTHAGSPGWTSFKTGVGDTSGNAIAVDGNSKYNSGDGVDGEIATGTEAHIKVRTVVDPTETVAGTREWDQVLAYTYTS